VLKHADEFIELLTKSFERISKVAQLKTAGGRVLLACEFLLGMVLLAALAMDHLVEFIAAAYSWARSMPYEFPSSDESFWIVAGSMFVSVVLVALREVLEATK
jgi:hypothetical protein